MFRKRLPAILAAITLAAPVWADSRDHLSFEPELASPTGFPPEPEFVHNRDSISDRPVVVFPFDGRLTFNTRADLGNDHGSVAIRREGLSANIVFGPEQPVQISLPVDFETSTYRFRDGSTPFVPGGADHVRSVQQLTLTPNVEVEIEKGWSVFGGALIVTAGQPNASGSDSLSVGGFVGVKRTWSDHFNMRFGILGTTQLSDDPLVFPAIAFEWKIDERTRLIGEGTELRFEYDISEAWTVKVSGSYDFRQYRLNDDGPLPRGVLRDASIPVTAHIEFTPHAAVRMEAWVGVNAYQRLRFQDHEGDRYTGATSGLSANFGVSFEIIF